MRIIQKLKFYVKEAIQAGKVVVKSDKSRVVLTGPTPFKNFISRLDPQEWNRFEAAERAFRQTISSGNIYEEKFICKGTLKNGGESSKLFQVENKVKRTAMGHQLL